MICTSEQIRVLYYADDQTKTFEVDVSCSTYEREKCIQVLMVKPKVNK
jgi:hypothetical protein